MLSQSKIKALEMAQAEIYMGGISRQDTLDLIATVYELQSHLADAQAEVKQRDRKIAWLQQKNESLQKTLQANPLTAIAEKIRDTYQAYQDTTEPTQPRTMGGSFLYLPTSTATTYGRQYTSLNEAMLERICRLEEVVFGRPRGVKGG